MYVCVCNKVTDSDLQSAIADGAHSMKALRKALQVGSNCGSCLDMTKKILDQGLQEQLRNNPDIYYAA